ncbi:hypothetical protein MXMO3_01824 [Maritalea myrionectae]|uniref:Uncharacterized protein n=1 Tax=Maritalea myrionectae TaxID=454601 RepID=A0A2R4MER0_9HYPH|nr:hypothetical protein [Maritalea myrionectae]AVX04349.1 hypothetical protein MXMO3_01824 [Maritalea myrionectae]
MTIKMKAAKRFRYGKPLAWLNPGDTYTVANEPLAKNHEKSGRGVRVNDELKPKKKGD